ncbi:selenocysteine-specific translation elongation factor [Pseudohongiella spirulinae]|uniref:Tr-type G domain-containing protein n=1 Tax=Pseudohongiella spirulinae TaxID=1249552 RepID=A0A0S2KCA3_9GAMM|nr:selenocysteine-specific translation elongation factor [Pseudohongiella spirulinae]ALO45944.1 hypothetical protein PS2015_1286 [Pseudohongiella spirulinae]
MIIATAGHVDHGKTTLIKALTGKNTDQLAEEQRRGLTIDLGFAWLHDTQAGSIGFVDVPGHSRFIRTMLAGLAGVDAALLVIAADEGPMPQTHEHLVLLELTGIERAIVVISAIERASPQQLSNCLKATQQLIKDTRLAGSVITLVDAISGRGMDELLASIRTLALTTPIRNPDGLPRFLIDRRFTVPGAGCVITGTLLNGRLSTKDQTSLRLAATNGEIRLRGIQIDGKPVSEIVSGQRGALNLTGAVNHTHPQRGDWLLNTDMVQSSQRLDVHLRVLPDQNVHRGTLQIIIGATAVSGRLVWLDQSAGLAQLLLDKPVHSIVGDTVILREPAANITLAGGQVLDPQGRQRGRSKPESVARLRALVGITSASDALLTELQHQAEIDLHSFAQRWNLSKTQIRKVMTHPEVLTLGDMALSKSRWAQSQQRLLQVIQIAHASQPEQLGVHQQVLLNRAIPDLSQVTGQTIIKQLINDGQLRQHGTVLALPDHQPRLPEQDQKLWPKIREAIKNAGLRPPIVGELGDQLGLQRDEMLAVMQRLQAWGYLLPVAPNRFYLPEQLGDLAAVAQALCKNSSDSGFLAAEYRDLSGIGRNLTIKVLEYLDRSGVTYYRAERRYLRPAWRDEVMPGGV